MSNPDVPWDDLDPGIREVVRWLNERGFRTTDSGDGVSKPEDWRALPFPHVAIAVQPSELLVVAGRLRDELELQGVVLGASDDFNKTPTIDASWDVGADAAIILLMGVSNDVLTSQACFHGTPHNDHCPACGRVVHPPGG